MKNIIRALTLIILTLTTMSACRELPLNGDLDAQWQITSITYPDGKVVDPEGKYYYCFYRHTGQLTGLDGLKITANIVYEGSSLSMEFPRENPWHLAPWGITCPADTPTDQIGYTAHFTVDHLSSKTLVLTTSVGVIISCRRY